MKKVGIIHREYEHFTLNKEVCQVLENNNVLIIGIVPNHHYKELIDLCDGVILQGGTMYTERDLEIVKYLYEKNIPTLGICLGMQMMGVLFNGKFEQNSIGHHYSQEKYVHPIRIIKETKLYDILQKDRILVNSRHHDSIKSTDMKISAISEDGVIEAVEDKEKNFFLGVQWHPESILDENNLKLWETFFASF